jgi:hypothetical protein
MALFNANILSTQILESDFICTLSFVSSANYLTICTFRLSQSSEDELETEHKFKCEMSEITNHNIEGSAVFHICDANNFICGMENGDIAILSSTQTSQNLSELPLLA